MDDYICWNMHGEEGCNVRDLEANHMHQETAADEQSEKLYACQDEEEVHSDNQAVGNDLSDDDLIQIGDNMSMWLINWRRWCVMPWGRMGILFQSLRN